MNDKVKTPIFAAVLGLICSLALASVSLFTAPYRDANEEAEKKLNFLGALDVPFEAGAAARELVRVFEENVRVKDVNGTPVYEYVPPTSGGTVVAAAVPFAGPGLWGPIHGVLALEPDMTTIRGIRFYKHEETPGLGGEISTDRFRTQFNGKKIVPAAGESPLRISKPGAAPDANSVDGITGATMTCDRVQDILNGLAEQLQEEKRTHE